MGKLVKKKLEKGKLIEQIADELEEDIITTKPIYELVKKNPNKEKEEIYEMLDLQ